MKKSASEPAGRSWRQVRLRHRAKTLIVCGILSFGLVPAVAAGQSSALADTKRQEPNGKTEGKKRLEFLWKDHPSLRIGELFNIDFRARFQQDVRRSDAPIEDSADATPDIARKRAGVEGRAFKAIAFQIERELAGTDPWRDVYLNIERFDFVQFQYGKFKLPFSLDENTGATNLDFVYRSAAANRLAPGRDRGWMVHGSVLHRAFGYEYGVFERDGNNAFTHSTRRLNAGETKAFRFTSEPFRRSKSPLADVRVGVAWTRGDVPGQSDAPEGFTGIRGRTVFDNVFFPADFYVRGRRERMGVEFRWRPGPASIKAEYIRLTEQRRGESVEDTDLSPYLAEAWYVSGTWAITGESKSEGLDRPKRPLLQGGYGAIEMAVRFEKLSFGTVATGIGSRSPRADVLPSNDDQILTLGVNWYANRWVKIQLNLIRELLTDPSAGPLPGQPGFWSRVIRVQFEV